jgi:hypothetical protein
LPKFLDVHSLEGIRDENALRELQQSPTDQFGVKHIKILSIDKQTFVSAYLKLPTEKPLKSIMKNIASNATGLQKYR